MIGNKQNYPRQSYTPGMAALKTVTAAITLLAASGIYAQNNCYNRLKRYGRAARRRCLVTVF